MNKIYYTPKMFQRDVQELACQIRVSGIRYNYIYGIPRGGIPLAVALSQILNLSLISERELNEASTVLVVDDVVDSGKTRNKYNEYDFACLHWKLKAQVMPTYSLYKGVNDWVVYFWEENQIVSADDSVIRMMQYIGEDVSREGLKDTPRRVVKSWDELFSGYKKSTEEILTTFESNGYDEIILLKDIELYSICEHHILPFFGKAHIAYIPDKKIIGISKLARLTEVYSRRLQIQERIGNQITADLMKHLKPKAAACIIEAQHLCVLMRGIQKQNSIMVTSSLKGAFMDNIASREELMRLIK